MKIRQLQTEDLRHSVPAVHPRLSVIKASGDQRPGLAGCARVAGAVVVDRVDAALAIDTAQRRAVETQQSRLAAAATNFEQAALREATTRGHVVATSEALAAFELLATDAIEADTRRADAGTARRAALEVLVGAIAAFERVEEQRRDAAATLTEAVAQVRTAPGPEPAAGRSDSGDHQRGAATEQLQGHVTAVHAALDKAEAAAQTEVTAAEQQLTTALARRAAADAAMAGIWARLAQVVDEDLLNRWGHGHPEPGMFAEHRSRLMVAKEAADWDLSSASAALATATRHRADEIRRLDDLVAPGGEAERVIKAIGGWLLDTTSAHESDRAAPDVVVMDDSFADLDPAIRAVVLPTLVGPSQTTQLIYLTEQLDVLAWAISLPHDVGGIDHVVTLSPPVPALSD